MAIQAAKRLPVRLENIGIVLALLRYKMIKNKNNIRILHVVMSLNPGGMETVLVNVAAQLAGRGFDIHVCGLEDRGLLADRFYKPDQVTTLAKPRRKSLKTVYKLSGLVHRVRPDIVHTHNLGPLIYGTAATGFGLQAPILHGEHCQLLGEDLQRQRLRLRHFLYHFCRRIHTVSRSQEEQLVDLGLPPKKIGAVVNGVDTSRFKPASKSDARKRLALDTDGLIIGIVARLSPRKRHELLMRAFAKIKPQNSNSYLLIVGDGPLRMELQQMSVELNVSDRIIFAGYQEDPLAYFQAIDLLVLPSTGEGLSNCVLEAMACAVPVLAHQACGNDEVIANGENGWIADIDSVQCLAELLSGALANPLKLERFGQSARQRVAEFFNFDRTVDHYERLYREIVSDRNRLHQYADGDGDNSGDSSAACQSQFKRAPWRRQS